MRKLADLWRRMRSKPTPWAYVGVTIDMEPEEIVARARWFGASGTRNPKTRRKIPEVVYIEVWDGLKRLGSWAWPVEQLPKLLADLRKGHNPNAVGAVLATVPQGDCGQDNANEFSPVHPAKWPPAPHQHQPFLPPR